MPIQDVGNNQVGLNADSSFYTLNGQVWVPPGGVLSVGMPLARNLLAIQSGYLSQFANVPGLAAFANGDNQVPIWNSGVQAATTGAGIAGGVYTGQPQQNPWLNQPQGTLNTTSLYAPSLIARSGLRLALCGAANGGTSVKVGDFVGKGATAGTTSLYPFLISAGGATLINGNTYGQVIAAPIWTTLAAGLTAGSAVAVQVFNTNGIQTTTSLTINPGQANQETVVPSAVTVTAPATAALTVATTATAAGTVQLTFNLAGYQGSTGTGPTGTNTTTFTVLVAVGATNTPTQTASAIFAALLNTGFCYGVPQNILGVGAGSFSQSTGAPASGPLIYVSQSAGVLTFSAAQPGTWANTLLTYTVTSIGVTAQTLNGAVGGSATAVAFANGVNGSITATFQNSHVAGEPVVGFNTTVQSSIIPVPGSAGMLNAGMALVDLVTA